MCSILHFSSKREFFAKGRNTYKIITEGEQDTILFETPSLIVHRYLMFVLLTCSKHDCPNLESNLIYIPQPELIDQISQSFAKAGVNQMKRTRKRKEKKTVKAVDEELDMFAD